MEAEPLETMEAVKYLVLFTTVVCVLFLELAVALAAMIREDFRKEGTIFTGCALGQFFFPAMMGIWSIPSGGDVSFLVGCLLAAPFLALYPFTLIWGILLAVRIAKSPVT